MDVFRLAKQRFIPHRPATAAYSTQEGGSAALSRFGRELALRGIRKSFVRTHSPRPAAVSRARPREQLRSAAVWRRIRVLKVGRIKRGWSGETEALTDAHRPTARTTSLTAKEIDFFERDRGFESLYLSPGSLSSSDRCAFRHTSTSASGWAYLNKPPMTEAKKITTPSKSNPVTIFLFRMRRAAGLRG